jgi:transcriptional regulator with XRE-family HTH domain
MTGSAGTKKGSERLSARLRSLRESKGMTMKQVARAVGIPVSTYREWEYGRAIQGEPYVALADAFGVGVSELLTGRAPGSSAIREEMEALKEHLARLERELASFL